MEVAISELLLQQEKMLGETWFCPWEIDWMIVVCHLSQEVKSCCPLMPVMVDYKTVKSEKRDVTPRGKGSY